MDVLQSQISKPRNKIIQWLSVGKYTIWYVLSLGIIVLVWKLVVSEYDSVIWFLSSQLLFLLLGILHVLLLGKTYPWKKKNNFWLETLWTVLMTAFSAILLSKFVSFPWIDDGTVTFYLSTLTFALPFFFAQAYKYWNAIPEKTWKSWQYPSGMEPPVIQAADQLIVTMKLDLIKEGQQYFPIKSFNLDLNRSLGGHLHYFIHTYNLKPEYGKIILTADPATNEPYNYIFYVKPWMLWWGRVLDFNEPVKNLGLKTGWTIEIQNI